ELGDQLDDRGALDADEFRVRDEELLDPVLEFLRAFAAVEELLGPLPCENERGKVGDDPVQRDGVVLLLSPEAGDLLVLFGHTTDVNRTYCTHRATGLNGG